MPEPLLLQARYRSKLEQRVAQQLHDAGVVFEFEPKDKVVRYAVPARKARYLPDFVVQLPGWRTTTLHGDVVEAGPTIILETKGWFKTKDRQKLTLIKEQFPALDIRLVFERAKNKISKESKTTYAQWADDHGFKWADKGVVPDEWIKELRTCQPSRATSHSSRKRKRS